MKPNGRAKMASQDGKPSRSFKESLRVMGILLSQLQPNLSLATEKGRLSENSLHCWLSVILSFLKSRMGRWFTKLQVQMRQLLSAELSCSVSNSMYVVQ